MRKRILYALAAILLMHVIGTVGFHYVEGLPWLDSLYFTTSTVTTVGYGDIVPVTQAGRVFSVFLILFGVGTVLYALTSLAQWSRYVSMKLKDSDISERLNLLIIAIRRQGGEMIFNPSGNTEIQAGDLLIVIGKAEGMKEFHDQ